MTSSIFMRMQMFDFATRTSLSILLFGFTLSFTLHFNLYNYGYNLLGLSLASLLALFTFRISINFYRDFYRGRVWSEKIGRNAYFFTCCLLLSLLTSLCSIFIGYLFNNLIIANILSFTSLLIIIIASNINIKESEEEYGIVEIRVN